MLTCLYVLILLEDGVFKKAGRQVEVEEMVAWIPEDVTDQTDKLNR